jgi:hypothetical protein
MTVYKITNPRCMVEVTEQIRELIWFIWNESIKARHVLSFDYVSEDGKAEKRDIPPYMICYEDKNKIKVVGLPRELWEAPIGKDRQPRHYYLNKIDIRQAVVISEPFIDPLVARDIVVSTKKAKVICRFIYPDEDLNEVMKTWVKVKGLDLI